MEASGNGDETRDLMRLDVAEQSVLLDVPGEICETDVVHALYAAVLREEAAASDESSSTVE